MATRSRPVTSAQHISRSVPVSAAWFLGGVVFAGTFSHLVRSAYRHFQANADCQATVAWFTGSVSLFAIYDHLVQSGLTVQSGTAFLGACTTLVLGVTSLLKELRLWKAGKRPETPES